MRFIAIFLLAITLLSVSVNGQSSASSCSFNGIDYKDAVNTTSYSATSLANGNNPAGKYKFYWNICAAAPTKCSDSTTVAACQISGGLSPSPTTVGLLSLGNFTAGKAPNSVILTYTTNTSPCGGGAFRSMVITLACGTGATVISGVGEANKCQYGVTMTGAALCGTSDNSNDSTNPTKGGGIGGGWIFIIVLLSATVVYIVGGVIFNAKVKHLHGSEMFPNRDLWVNFGGLIKDGVFFIKSKVTGGGAAGYQQV